MGEKLAATGIEEYTLAGAKTGGEVVALMTGNMCAFSSPICHWEEGGYYDEAEGACISEHWHFENTDFSYNMMSLEDCTVSNTLGLLFAHSNISSFSTKLCSLSKGE